MSDFSARNVGERVHTLGTAWAKHSRCSWEDTVRYLGERKKWSCSFWVGLRADAARVPVTTDSSGPSDELEMETVKTSPAPSQSEEVMRGGWIWTNSLSRKKSVILAVVHERNWSNAACFGSRDLKCSIDRKNSGV